MSYQAVSWAYEQDITPSGAKFVLVTLANYANGDGYCYPGQASIAQDTGMSARAVRGHLDRLEADELIFRQHRYDRHGKRTSDGYWLVGFKPLPEDVAGSLPEESAASDEVLPATIAPTTGNYCSDYRKNLPVLLKDEPSEEEPSEGILIPPAVPERLTTFMALFEILTGNPYTPKQTNVPDGLARKIGKVESALADFGVNVKDGDEVLRRWPRLRQKYPKATIHALPEHWHSLRDEAWADYLEAEHGDKRTHSDPIANARSLIERKRKSGGAGGDAGSVHDRPQADERLGDRALGWHVPSISDGRT